MKFEGNFQHHNSGEIKKSRENPFQASKYRFAK